MFKLPASTKVDRIIPKNSFEDFSNTKAKKLFVESVDKIKWTNKISYDTVNLDSKDVKEIQIFEIKLKKLDPITDILKIIDKAIPYPIIFILSFDDNLLISVSLKHSNPFNEDNAVIDWIFKTDWFKNNDFKYSINLKNNIDFVYKDFCTQLSNVSKFEKGSLSIRQIAEMDKKIYSLKESILKLKSLISKTRQFNKKVELNLELKKLESELQCMFEE